MAVTLLGMVTAVNDVQSANAWSPRDTTLSGIITDLNTEQLKNALLGIEVTDIGISTVS